MSDNMTASRQWAKRPADERFWSVEELEKHLEPIRATSKVIGEPEQKTKKGKLEPTLFIKDLRVIGEGNDLKLVGPNGGLCGMTNHTFGQLCTHLEAPASYISKLPTDLALQNLAFGFSTHGDIPVKVLLQRTGTNGAVEARAITGPNYSRIWDLDICRNLKPAFREGWVIPPARPANDDPRSRPATDADCFDQGKFWGSIKPGDMIAPAGVYRGDRDSFIFAVRPDRTIDDGGGNGGLMRGIFISNSEVGARAFKVTTFLLENVCGNHICWGTSELVELKMVHKGRAKELFSPEMMVRLRKYNDSGLLETEAMIQRAKQFEIAGSGEMLIKRLFGIKSLGVSKLDLTAAFAWAEQWEHTAKAPPTTAWGFVHGLTRYSQTMDTADARHDLDVAGGKILSMALAG